MAKGFKHGAGGGASLNFKVVGGTTEPASPKENTIWVNTDAEITGWDFRTTQPETAQEGMVWFSVGTASTVAFNALKKNSVMVYPLSAKQYIGGALVNVGMKIYQDGAWRSGELYYNGDECVNITGGWIDRTSHDGSWYTNGVIEKLPNSIRLLCATQKKLVAIGPTSAVDLTEYSTIKINVTAMSRDTGIYGRFAVRNVLPVEQSKFDARVGIDNGAGIYSLDVSALSGKYYISMMAWADQNAYGELVFDKVWME